MRVAHRVVAVGAAVLLTAAMTVLLSWAVLFLRTPVAPLIALLLAAGALAARHHVVQHPSAPASPAGVAGVPGPVAPR